MSTLTGHTVAPKDAVKLKVGTKIAKGSVLCLIGTECFKLIEQTNIQANTKSFCFFDAQDESEFPCSTMTKAFIRIAMAKQQIVEFGKKCWHAINVQRQGVAGTASRSTLTLAFHHFSFPFARIATMTNVNEKLDG